MKTKIFLSAIALAVLSITFIYNNSYSQTATCCCTDCQCQSCVCAETCCKDGSCSGCSDNACCDNGGCATSCCSSDNSSSGETSCCSSHNSSSGLVSFDSDVCIVSGEKLEKGKEVVFNYMGKNYNFCCQDCLEGFKNEPIKFVKEINCPVMEEPVKKNISTVHEGTKYYFCCKMCISDFKDSPGKYLKKNDSK